MGRGFWVGCWVLICNWLSSLERGSGEWLAWTRLKKQKGPKIKIKITNKKLNKINKNNKNNTKRGRGPNLILTQNEPEFDGH